MTTKKSFIPFLFTACLTFIPILYATEVENYAKDIRRSVREESLPPPPRSARYRDSSLPIEERIDDLLRWMTPYEKAKVLHACGEMSAGNIARLGLAEFRTIDGGVGPRAENCPGITYMPCGIAWAATWDQPLIEAIGRVSGAETRALYKDQATARMLLGPGGNIGGRIPFCARAYEYFGEDPLLAGKTAAAFIRGLQSCKVAACMKHYIGNDQEWYRTVLNVNIGERALREIYARPFEIAIREGGVWAIMNSYNAFRGTWTSWNRPLNDLLYKEFKWDGALFADWGGYRDDRQAIAGGTTIETSCQDNPDLYTRELCDLKTGKIRQADFDDQVRRALRLYFRIGAFDSESVQDRAEQQAYVTAFRSQTHQDIAYRTAAEAFVLLENQQDFLPIDASKIKTIAVVGPNADQYHSMIDGSHLRQRGGSGAVKAAREITPLQGFCMAFGEAHVLFAPGFRFDGTHPEYAISVPGKRAIDPLDAARQADLVVFCAGYDHSVDREVIGWGIQMPAERDSLLFKVGVNGERQEDLIRAIAAVNPNLIVAVTTGGPFDTTTFRDRVKAILITWYGGEFGGRVLADIVCGAVNPSGKIPYSFGRKPSDWPSIALGERSYPGIVQDGITSTARLTARDCVVEQTYLDDIWVGYRGFDRTQKQPLYPFGFGLSYTTFKIKPVRQEGNTFIVSVTNSGTRDGRAVIQCYLSKPTIPGVDMPQKELVDYSSLYLKRGETQNISLSFPETSLQYWDEKNHCWKTPKGTFRVRIGDSSASLPVEYSFIR